MSDLEDVSESENCIKTEDIGSWGCILSEVQNDLPMMDTDSECSSLSDDVSTTVFSRTLPGEVFANKVTSKKDRVPFASASSLSSPYKTNGQTVLPSNSLLCQRLQKHLDETVESGFVKEDLLVKSRIMGKLFDLCRDEEKLNDSHNCNEAKLKKKFMSFDEIADDAKRDTVFLDLRPADQICSNSKPCSVKSYRAICTELSSNKCLLSSRMKNTPRIFQASRKMQNEVGTTIPINGKLNTSDMNDGGKLKEVLSDIKKGSLPKGTNLLYDRTFSFNSDIPAVPPTLNEDTSEMVLITITKGSMGQVVFHRASSGHKPAFVDPATGLPITYALVLSWLLTLIPENVENLQQHKKENTPYRELESQLLGKNIKDDDMNGPNCVDVPFKVMSLNQCWQEDVQSLCLTVIVVPNLQCKCECKKGKRKSKKEDAFLIVVRQFLQSHSIQDMLPWYDKPESPTHYIWPETTFSCTKKPLSTYMASTNDVKVIKKALMETPSFFSKVIPDDSFLQPDVLHQHNSEMTMFLLHENVFMQSIVVFDILIRIQVSCFDLSGVRLCYVPRRVISETTGNHMFSKKATCLKQIIPCVVMAISGHLVHTRWAKIVGPRDPVLARMLEQQSLNAIYGEQLLGPNVFYHPPSATKALQQIIFWFGGHINPRRRGWKSSNKFINIHDNEKLFLNNNNETERYQYLKIEPKDHFLRQTADSLTALEKMGPRCSLIVTSSIQKIYLIISPCLPTQLLSDILCTAVGLGFHLIVIRRLRLDKRKLSALSIPQRYHQYFSPRFDQKLSDKLHYLEDNWQLRPSIILLLSKENAICHQPGLLHALQTKLMRNIGSTKLDGYVRSLSHMCFCTSIYHEETEHVIKVANKTTESELKRRFLPPLKFPFSSSSEMEQVIVLSIIGDEAVDSGMEFLKNVLHGDFPCNEDNSIFEDNDTCDRKLGCERFQGFELIGIKRISSLPRNLANELCPHEIGTRDWKDVMHHLIGSPVIVVVLRRENALWVMQTALSSARSHAMNNDASYHLIYSILISPSQETAYCQACAFFSDKELFPDNQCRPLLKYLPNSARLLQFCSSGTCCTISGICQQNREKLLRSGHLSNFSCKKKKKQEKCITQKDVARIRQASDQNVPSSHILFLNESFFSFMTTHNQPLFSIVVMKPDAFPRHFTKIMMELYQHDFAIVAMKMLKMTENEALQIAPPVFKEMQGECEVYLDHMLSYASLVLCVQRINAIRYLKKLAGPCNPQISRTKCYRNKVLQVPLRARFGIDMISNGLHVSESYDEACKEIRLFFPDGLCCESNTLLLMESIQCPAFDQYLSIDNMKGREAYVTELEPVLDSKFEIEIKEGLPEPIVAVLMPRLLDSCKTSRPNSHNSSSNNDTIPPYVIILEQLLNQGFEVCAMRMVWCQESQPTEVLDVLDVRGHKVEYSVDMAQGPILLILLQRQHASMLFNCVLKGIRYNGNSLYNEYSPHILRSHHVYQTMEAARYFFPLIPHANSCIQIRHCRRDKIN